MPSISLLLPSVQGCFVYSLFLAPYLVISIGWDLCGKWAPGHLLCDFLGLQEALLQDLYPSSPFLPKRDLFLHQKVLVIE